MENNYSRGRKNFLSELLGRLFSSFGNKNGITAEQPSLARSKTIFLAGGPFWAVEAYFSKLPGVVKTYAGYANGGVPNPCYEDVQTQKTGFAQAVMIQYDPQLIGLKEILENYFEITDPVYNKDSVIKGLQYRKGIYYVDEDSKLIAIQAVSSAVSRYNRPIEAEVKVLSNFYPAEQEHQKYYEKNPDAHCPLDLSKLARYTKYKKPSDQQVRSTVDKFQYGVIKYRVTEPAYTGKYCDCFDEGIYVDIVTGEPLFSSRDKYQSGHGWPAFKKAIDNFYVVSLRSVINGEEKTELRSKIADSHLGYLYNDGPDGGLRYCVYSAALRFIPLAQMQKEGYSDLLYIFNTPQDLDRKFAPNRGGSWLNG